MNYKKIAISIIFFSFVMLNINISDAQTTRRPVVPVKLTKEQASQVKKEANESFT